ncbi:hypothetical protein LAUMK4_00998 [Mycobacterium persicum]|nr:DUF5134 domain-containing protein [Mycobacterium persicum]VAZ72536.1 hypothetical protein LAUMK15_01353 [Mycobacterium persicum]VAZ89298.1 hypothetical protein LAUMK4_00998 [Mycobacterium persicum]
MSAAVLNDAALRWAVAMIFGVSIAADAYVFGARDLRSTVAVDHLLHLSMSAAMIAMAWRIGPASHGLVPIVFFLLAAGWFVLVAGRRRCTLGDRMANCYNATMMIAMAWMYMLMNGGPAAHGDHSPDPMLAGSAPTHIAGGSMPAAQMPQTGSWIATANWIVTLGFAVAAMLWLWRYVGARRAGRSAGAGRLAELGLLSQAFAAVGTALMFGVMG